MRVTRLIPVWLFVAIGTGASAQEFGDARRGLEYAKKSCSDCHAVLAAETSSPRPNATTFKQIANVPGMTETALLVWLRTPHKAMPDLIIDPKDQADVIAYIVSLRDKPSSK